MTDTSRGTLVRMALDLLMDLATKPPFYLHVSWPDFKLWAAQLAVEEVSCELQDDGRVAVTAIRDYPDWGMLFVRTVVDVVHGVELPPARSGRIAHLPLAELDRCELFGKAVA